MGSSGYSLLLRAEIASRVSELESRDEALQRQAAETNAAMESFFGSLKSEWLHHQHFASRQEAMSSIFYYIEVFYNRQRLHSANRYRSPAEFERLTHQTEHLSYQRVH